MNDHKHDTRTVPTGANHRPARIEHPQTLRLVGDVLVSAHELQDQVSGDFTVATLHEPVRELVDRVEELADRLLANRTAPSGAAGGSPGGPDQDRV